MQLPELYWKCPINYRKYFRRYPHLSKIELTPWKRRENRFPIARRLGNVVPPDGTDRSGSKIVTQYIKKFVANESGATAIEYALIASLVAVAIIAALGAMGTKLQNTFGEVSSNLS